MSEVDERLDLTLERIMTAPPSAVWRAWTEAALLERWWVPAPATARVERLDARPGGAFVATIIENGQEMPHTDGVFLVVEPERRLAFTNAITSGWRPAAPEPVPMTAEILLDEHPEGTWYRAIVRHGDPSARDLHESLGFFEGWGTVTADLARVAESLAG